jgi:thiamine biosynthesis lipoprotein
MIEPKVYFPNTVINKMNIPFTVKLAVTEDDRVADHILATTSKMINKELDAIEQKFSPFKEDSLVSKYRRGDSSPLMEDSLFQAVFSQCSIAEEVTSGYFNAFYDGRFNPTGLVKGWAIETIFQLYMKPLLVDPKIIGVSLNGGGDMQLATKDDSNFSWSVGIENPYNTQEIIAEYSIKNGAVATSGMNKRGEHISRNASNIKQVTIIANSLTEADVWATAGIAAGTDKFEDLIQSSELTGMYVDDVEGMTSFAGGKMDYAEKTQI